MLKLFAVINIIIDIAVLLYLYFGGKIQKRKEKLQDKADRSCVICAIQTLLAYNEKMLEQRQNTENNLIELESIKYIMAMRKNIDPHEARLLLLKNMMDGETKAAWEKNIFENLGKGEKNNGSKTHTN